MIFNIFIQNGIKKKGKELCLNKKILFKKKYIIFNEKINLFFK